jgi:hypothetical protein
MRAGTVGLMLSLALLTGCASAPRTQAQRYDVDQSSCVDSIMAVPALPIPFAEQRKDRFPKPRSFEQVATCMLAQDGNPIPVVLMGVSRELPLEVQVYLLTHREIALAASIDLLDDERRLLRTVPFSDFVRRGGAYSGSIFLNKDDDQVRFLLMRPDPDAVGSSDASVVGKTNTAPAVFAAGSALYLVTIRTGNEALSRTWLSEVGEFSVRSLSASANTVVGK